MNLINLIPETADSFLRVSLFLECLFSKISSFREMSDLPSILKKLLMSRSMGLRTLRGPYLAASGWQIPRGCRRRGCAVLSAGLLSHRSSICRSLKVLLAREIGYVRARAHGSPHTDRSAGRRATATLFLASTPGEEDAKRPTGTTRDTLYSASTPLLGGT